MFYRKLFAQRDKLLLENEQLRNEYEEKKNNSKVNDDIASMKNHTGERGGKYGTLFYHPDYHTKWKGTFFDTQRRLIESLDAYPLNRIKKFKRGDFDNPFAQPYNESSYTLLGHCDMVAPSKYGPILHIVDPYGNFTFPPIHFVTFEEATKWVGRIIMVEALYKYGRKAPKVIGVKVLSFTLYDDLRKTV